MALPAALKPDGAVGRDYGVEVRLTPGIPPNYSIELQRAPDDGTGNPNVGSAVSFINLAPLRAGGASFVDLLPRDNAFGFYRWRHIGNGYDPGTWTAWARGKPTLLPSELARGGLVSVYPIQRPIAYVDGDHAVAASPNHALP